jgi:ribosome-binding factor A
MSREFSRTRRIGEQLRRELAQLMREEIGDPRMAMVSITSVVVTRDLSQAKVYVTILGDPAERGAVIAGLNQVAALLRHQLGRKMYIRTVPRLEFLYDEVVEWGARLSALISQTVAADAARHCQDDRDEEQA